jgi:DNA polymerase (family 10)
MGPKKVALVWKELGVESIDDLKKAIASGKMAELPGLGATSVKKIADGLAFREKSSERTPMGVAWAVAELMVQHLKALRGVKRVEVAGSLRRGVETIGDIDILCEAADGEKIIKAFTEMGGVSSVQAAGKTKGSVLVDLEAGRQVQVDLRVVPAESFGAAWQYFTGSKEHNIRVREIATRKKWKLNEYGLFDAKDKQLAGKTEKSIYDKLGLPFMPPEMREDRGELEAGEKSIAGLIALEHIRGDLHMHTTASDGKCTAEEMAAAARELGYDYIAICDHSKSSAIANGLSIERMEKQIETLRALNKTLKDFEILVGCECDIHSDGTMDYPDAILAECDLVVASIHAGMGQSREQVTRRTIAAMENPYVTIIGHPTGRLLGRRDAMDLDVAAVVKAAVETGTVLEINASWQRLDLKDVHARQALDAGVTLAIDTDSHHTDQLLQMRFGVQTARRAWTQKEDVLNTRTLAQLKKFIARKRGGK